MATTPGEIRPFHGRAVPEQLRRLARWAPWRAVWNEKRGKYDKVPVRADTPEYGLSTADPSRWFTFEAAVRCYERNKPSLAGVGLVMTGITGIVGIDLDDCVAGGVVAPWAQEIVEALDSYTEISPSGRGLRMFVEGSAEDWTNHEVGVEVYGGTAARFLTLTGEVMGPGRMRAVEAPLVELRQQYGREAKPEVPAGEIPELLPDLVLPDLPDLELPPRARDFLTEGAHRGDRSAELQATAVALFQAGLGDAEVLSILAGNPHAMAVALDHRRQDPERALAYLWKEHTAKARGKAEPRVARAEDFTDVAPAAGPGAAPALRFKLEYEDDLYNRPPMKWLVRGLLPKAEVAVVWGPPASGKTFWVLDLVGAIVRGAPWRDLRVEKGRVLYICAEGVGGFRNRLKAHTNHHGPMGRDFAAIADAPNFIEKQDVKDVVASIRAFGPCDLVVVDTLAQVTPGADENSSQDMGRVLAHCKAVSKATGALVLLVHHSGKDTNRGARGWSGLFGNADVNVEITRAGGGHSAFAHKVKDSEDGMEWGFRLDVVTIGQDDEGETVTSCVVHHGEAAPRVAPGPKGATQKLVLRVAAELLGLGGELTTSTLIDNCVAQIPFDKGEGKQDKRRRDVMRALESLVEAGRMGTVGGLVNMQ